MDLITRGSFRLFRVASIDVFVHWTWFVVAWIQISLRPDYYRSQAWKVAEYVSLFGIVLLHEFGHALACRSVGGRAKTIVLWPLGGVAFVSPPNRPGAVLWSIAAGPLVNLALVPVTMLLVFWADTQGLKTSSRDFYSFLEMMTLMNGILLVFNMLPIYPLDGGQIVQSLLWFVIGRWRSLQVVSLTGVFFGIALFFLGLFFTATNAGSIMLSVMAAFIVYRSIVSFQQARGTLFLLELPRHHECACPRCGIGPPQGPFWVCKEYCQSRFDLFATRGKCPSCGAWYLNPECPHCGRTNHIDKWFSPPAALPSGPAMLEAPAAPSPPA
jgi:Zn-dependent protease